MFKNLTIKQKIIIGLSLPLIIIGLINQLKILLKDRMVNYNTSLQTQRKGGQKMKIKQATKL
jgi:hypothetical protein